MKVPVTDSKEMETYELSDKEFKIVILGSSTSFTKKQVRHLAEKFNSEIGEIFKTQVKVVELKIIMSKCKMW